MTGKEEYTLGLGGWRPQFLQKFATIKYFMIVYGLLGTIQAMSFVYFIATLTTLEKRFQIRSEVTGILMTGNEMSQIFLSIILAYRGGKGNRPVWIAWGVLFSSLSCYILALPHLIYGPGSNALALTEEFVDYRLLNTTDTNPEDSNPILCAANRPDTEECEDENAEKPMLSLFLIFFSQFVLGIGTTLYVTLGTPYLDDNSKKKNIPKFLGMTMALRTAGPAGGFVLGYLCLSMYIEPSLTPVIERNDPRWLGAWWLGWIILGSIMTIFSFLIASFPKELKPNPTRSPPVQENKRTYEAVAVDNSKNQRNETNVAEYEMTLLKNGNNEKDADLGILSDFKNAMKRVCTNPLLMCNNLTAVFYILGASGYINFYTKYAETQFYQSAAYSSMIAGVSTVTSMLVGFIASGFIISKFKPKTSYLLMFNILIAVVYMTGELIFMFMGCDENTLQGNATDIGTFNPNSWCNTNCSCERINYSPVCFEKGNQTFFSACHAGCTHLADVSKRTYSNCTCLPDPSDIVRQGPCNVNCLKSFIVFVGVQCLIQLIGCSGRITTVLVNYRCVQPRDKPLAQGICLFMISLLAFIPGPIIYGRVVDSTCQIWDKKCGKRGNCWVYNNDDFRFYLNSTAMYFTFGAFVFDIVVWYLGRNLNLYDETTDKDKT